MTSLQDGKLDDKTIYFDFNNNAKHNPFWETEFTSVHHYYIDLIAQTRVFHHYNPTVLQELAYYNDPLNYLLNQTGICKHNHHMSSFPIPSLLSNGIQPLTSGSTKIEMEATAAHIALNPPFSTLQLITAFHPSSNLSTSLSWRTIFNTNRVHTSRHRGVYYGTGFWKGNIYGLTHAT